VVSAPLRLMLLRHAPVAGLAPGVCYGALDVPADEAATEAAAQAIAPQLPPSTPVWTSSRQRTRALGAAIARLRPDLPPPLADPRLDEMDFGAWEGRPWSTVSAGAFDAWMADFAHHRVGGGESVAQLLERVAQALAALAADLRPQAPGEDRAAHALWITHAGVIRAVHYLLANGRRMPLHAADWPAMTLALGGAWMVELPVQWSRLQKNSGV
jgi:alpha-ribazole phosphatase